MHPRTLQDVAKLSTQREWVWKGTITSLDVTPGYYWVLMPGRSAPLRAASITRAQHYPGDVVLGINAYRNSQLPMILDTISSDVDMGLSWLGTGWLDQGRDGTRAANSFVGGWISRVNLRNLDTQWQISTNDSPLIASTEGRMVIDDDVYAANASTILEDTDIGVAGVVWQDKWYGGTWESIACVSLANGTTKWTNTAASIGSSPNWMSFVYSQYTHSSERQGQQDAKILVVCAIEPGEVTIHLRAVNTKTGATLWTRTQTAPELGIPRSGREALVQGYLADVVMIASLCQEDRTTNADLSGLESSLGVPAYQIEVGGGHLYLQAWRITDGEEAWTVDLTPDGDCVLDDPIEIGRILVSFSRAAVVYRTEDLPTSVYVWDRGGLYIYTDGGWTKVDQLPPGFSGPNLGVPATGWAFELACHQKLSCVEYHDGSASVTVLDSAALLLGQDSGRGSRDPNINYLDTESYYALRTGGMECAYLTRDGHITKSAYYLVPGTYEETGPWGTWPPLTLPALLPVSKSGSATADLYAFCLSDSSHIWTYTMAAPDPTTQHYTWDMLSYGRNGYAIRCLLTNDVRGQNALTEFGPGYFGTQSSPTAWTDIISVVPTTDLVLADGSMFIVSTDDELRRFM